MDYIDGWPIFKSLTPWCHCHQVFSYLNPSPLLIICDSYPSWLCLSWHGSVWHASSNLETGESPSYPWACYFSFHYLCLGGFSSCPILSLYPNRAKNTLNYYSYIVHPLPLPSLSSPPPGHPLPPQPVRHWAVSLHYARYIFHYSQFFFSLFCCDGKKLLCYRMLRLGAGLSLNHCCLVPHNYYLAGFGSSLASPVMGSLTTRMDTLMLWIYYLKECFFFFGFWN